MLENVYVKAGGTGKCLHGGGGGHGSPNQITLSQVSPTLVALHSGDTKSSCVCAGAARKHHVPLGCWRQLIIKCYIWWWFHDNRF
jgi:hypothetical protein